MTAAKNGPTRAEILEYLEDHPDENLHLGRILKDFGFTVTKKSRQALQGRMWSIRTHMPRYWNDHLTEVVKSNCWRYSTGESSNIESKDAYRVAFVTRTGKTVIEGPHGELYSIGQKIEL